MKAPPTLKKPPAPRHLAKAERDLWRRIVDVFSFTDAASLAMLCAAMDAHQRARQARETITRDGMTFRDRFGQLRPHPLLAAERDARAAFISACRALNLDLGKPE